MKKKKDAEPWHMLWRSEKKTIEEILKDAIEYFVKKHKVKPEKILVNPDVKLTSYDGISLVKDKQMFSLELICMTIPNTAKEL